MKIGVKTAAALLPLLCAVCAAADEDLGSLLRERGLVLRGVRWELKDEALLQRRLSELERRQREIVAARRALDTLIKDNAARWNQISRQVGTLESQLKSLPTSHKDRPGLERQLAQLRRQAVAPQQLPASAPARAIVQPLVDWELELMRKLPWTRRTLAEVRAAYRELAADQRVTRQLAASKHLLGSAERYRNNDALLDDCAELVERSETPLLRQGGQWRIGVLVNGRTPVTASWLPQGEQHLIPASLAEACGAEADDTRAATTLQVAPGRSVRLRPIRLRRVRIGGMVREGVEAWKLPPEAEDLGATLGQYALAPWTLELRPAELKAIVRVIR